MATPTGIAFPSTTTTTATAAPSCTTAAPGPHGYVPVDACNANWPYFPSFAGAVAFTALFGTLTVAHLVLAILHRKLFCWVIVMGAAWEFGAFITRSLGSQNQQNIAFATVSQILFILSPLWINAFVYMVAGRLVYMLHPDKKIWRLKAVSTGKWFVWLDIVSFIVQATGGLMLSPGADAKTMKTGKTIYMGGIGLQMFFIFLFIGLLVRFHLDLLKVERQGLLGDGKRSNKWWKFVTYTLYAVLILIIVRIIFRLCEFSGGMDPKVNQLPFKEGYALALDAFPMMLAILLLAVVHPGIVLKGPESQFPSRKERKAEKKAKKEEKKRLKAAKKAGIVPDTQYTHAHERTSDERLVGENVELGQVGWRSGRKIARV